MKLSELINSIKDRSLTKEMLEGYFDQLSELKALLLLEYSENEKSEALFIDQSEEETDAAKKRKWRASKEGLRGIEIRNYVKAIDPLLSSVKNRIYSKL